eukprot:749625-Amphidinium_carterae.1
MDVVYFGWDCAAIHAGSHAVTQALWASLAALAGFLSYGLDCLQPAPAFTIATADNSGIRNLKVNPLVPKPC